MQENGEFVLIVSTILILIIVIALIILFTTFQKKKIFLVEKQKEEQERFEKEIADIMCLSPKTIDNYRNELFTKLNVKNRVGLVMYAIKNKIYTP